MCVGLSARVVRINENGTALVDASGAKRQVSAQLLEDLEPGDYVMVHAGAAISKITSDDRTETDELLEELKKYDLDDIFIIGGSQIYTLMVPYCDTLYVTKVNYAYQADTWFTNLDLVPEWKLVEESEEQTCFNIEYTFRTYERKYHTARPV